MEITRLPKCVMFWGLVGGVVSVRGRKSSVWGVFWTTPELSISVPASGLSQLKMRIN